MSEEMINQITGLMRNEQPGRMPEADGDSRHR